MTCLHCGKKLGFFSRYKDTPFCCEEHLRTHQDELERALMERLGSKTAAPPRSLSELAMAGSAPLKSMQALDQATKVSDPKPFQEAKPVPPPLKVAPVFEAPAPVPQRPVEVPKPIEQVAQIEAPKKKPEQAPAPLHEELLLTFPNPAQFLDIDNPMIPTASFAIVHQPDYCVPNISTSLISLGFEPVDTEFDFDQDSLLRPAAELKADLPHAFETESFGEPWIEFPRSTRNQVSVDMDFTADPVSLDYEAFNTPLRHTALGQRNELDPRIRLRFPYAASQVTSTWSDFPTAEEVSNFTSNAEWDPILPSEPTRLEIVSHFSETPNLRPKVDVKLSIGALVNFNLDAADIEDFGNSLAVIARALDSTSGMTSDCKIEGWSSRLALPNGTTLRATAMGWPVKRSLDRVPPVPFPSLFQLGSVLPPRPESSAGQ